MSFNFDVVLLIVAIFMFLSGLYFGFYNQLRRTLSSVVGLACAIFLNDLLVGIISAIGNTKSIIAKVVNVVFVMEADIAIKLFVGLIVYLVVKLIMYLIIGAFKRRDVKSFLKDKSSLSCIIGGILGLVNAYVVGLILFLIFINVPGAIASTSISIKIFGILPQIKEVIEAITVVA
ncbi:MAG: hypothetical protein J5691_07260 [Bacilli bacterium]|nr:hypothetical protein [Bacilli bacterium]